MSATDTLETGILSLILQNANLANIGDATGLRGSTTAGSLYISLHTADPGETGSQTTSETSYTNYVRVAVTRASGAGGWTVSGNNGSNTSTITFATCGVTGATLTHFGIGTASSGAGTLLFKGSLTSSLAVSNGITPSFAAADLDVNAD
jgi:hypothetical protein